MEKDKIPFRKLFTQKDYLKVLTANTISRFGDSIDSIAFTWLVYAITGSASWSAIILAVNYLPTVLLQPFTGTLVENMNKKRVMIITDIIRGIVVSALAILYIQNMVTPAVLIIFTLMISTSEAFTQPASMAIMPKILEKDLYNYGISLNGTLSSAVQFIGLAAAGIIISVFGIQAAIFIDALTFLISALVTALAKIKETNPKNNKLNFADFFGNLKQGFTYVISNSIIRNFIIMAVLLNALLVPLNAFQAPLIKDVLGQGSELLSIMGIGTIIGMTIGSALFPLLSKLFTARTRLTLGGGVIGIMYILLLGGVYFKDNTILVSIVSLAANLFLGLAAAAMNATVSVLFMQNVEESYLSRASAIMNSGAVAAMPLTSALCSLLALYLPISFLFITSGCLCILMSLVIWMRKVRFE